MRLTAIKLAGFKSFVDPTHLRLNSNLTGIVGPNGCGKSNVIDAVRWVTGESSAKQLRGEALEDVIFNGSKARKPVGRASIELLFDNSAGKLGGQYASFSEISIRRELARDGASQYYINSARSRRRDVVDLFLGTGLGGKSNYAVIEQGAVNRLVEAKPEDMRNVLEEAAGISKYKERRRETENRIRHTRENLDRLNDLVAEVTQRLAQLQRQAANAEKYKQFKSEERTLRAQLLALRWRALDTEAQRQEVTLGERRRELEGAQTTAREAQARRENQRQEQQTLAHQCQRLQADFYSAESEVARVEQALAHARELLQVREKERDDLKRTGTELDERAATEKSAKDSLEQQITGQAQSLDAVDKQEASAREQLELAQRELQAGEQDWDALNSSEGNPIQRAETERTRVEHLEQSLAALAQRLDRHRTERQRLDGESPTQALKDAQALVDRLAGEMTGLRDDYSAAETEVTRLRESRSEADGILNKTRQTLANEQGRLTSLEALQQAALREDDADLQQWLETQGWNDVARVAHKVRVSQGWETAAEAALGGFIRALAVPNFEKRVQALSQWPDYAMTLLSGDSTGEMGRGDAGPPQARSLASVLDGPLPLRRLAQRIYLVEDDAAARQGQASLSEGQMLVTRAGVCYGPGWVRTPRLANPEEGLLKRGQTIEALRKQVADLKATEQDKQTQMDDLRERLQTAEQARGMQAARMDEVRRRHGESLAERQGLQVRVEQIQRRNKELNEEIDDLRKQQAECEANLKQTRERLDAVSGAAKEHVQRRQAAQEKLQKLRDQLKAARSQREHSAERRQALQVDLAGSRSALQATEQRLRELEERRGRVFERGEVLAREIAEFNTPDEATEKNKSDTQIRRDQARLALEQARTQLKDIEGLAEAQAREAQVSEQAVEATRERMQQAQVAFETAAVRRQTLEEQLAEIGHTPQNLCEALSDQDKASEWEQKIESVERRISRLGAINLAAIEEFEQEKERETYLQGQHADLSEALNTLEQAIAKIDRETRMRFRETFQKVNQRFSEMFPVLFGGGEARLELTEDDLLETGVRVMARPPGKRNASIQMLSGGEKALTAVALLFALFELNPAPFCMLDEIDAPLDDANVARFCDLVRKMSEHVQFIVITHNKLTMELAQQLHGVTMAEPGVSRLVSVDIDQALAMAS